MSIFQRTDVACPSCDAELTFDLVVSVSADRRPDLRTAILDRSFQRMTCPHCAALFRVAPEFTYIDIARGQYVVVWPPAKRSVWQSLAQRSQAGFDRAFGKNASGEARAVGDKLDPRVVFGWPALVEKIIAKEAGLDDRTLEVAKVAVMTRMEIAPLPGLKELRLVGMHDGDLLIGWVLTDGEQVSGRLQVPSSLIDEIEADPPAWQELRNDVSDGLVVDFQREMLTPAS